MYNIYLNNVTWVTLVILLTSQVTWCDVVNGPEVAALLQEMANGGLGVQAMQDYLDDHVTYSQQKVNGQALIEQLSSSLDGKFQESITAVKNLRDTISSEFTKYTSDMNGQPLCCEATNLETDEDFKQMVNVNYLCNDGVGTLDVDPVYPTSALLETMKQNRQANPGLKWQYFGSETGILTTYPASEGCFKQYDPRFRPWYVEAATPVPKDVVIVIDKSGSMNNIHDGQTLMNIAKDAALTVINTLNPNDRVGLVAFSNEAITPQGSRDTSTCYQSQLAQATPINKAALQDFLGLIGPGGSTQYSKAFSVAFDMLTNTPQGYNEETRNKVILFMTDGQPTDILSQTKDIIRTKNAALDNKVVILTFGLGQAEMTPEAIVILEELAAQSFGDASAGSLREGQFVHVSNPSDLRSSMATYYNFFSQDGTELVKPVFTVPYLDYAELGLVISVCLPVYSSQTLIGVTCIDIVVSDLLSSVTYFQQGALSYGFVVDETGRTLIHHLMPTPLQIVDDPIFVHLTSLERHADIQNILDKMVMGEAGNRSLSTTFVSARGDTEREGVYTTTALADYFWKQIGETGLTVCIVLAEAEVYYTLDEQTSLPDSVHYYRLDLTQPDQACHYMGSIALKDSSTVKFNPSAFIDPFLYIGFAESLYQINGYEFYLTGVSNINNRLKEGIRDSVAVTGHVDAIWRQRNATYALWRSIGTEDGVYRVFPGTVTDILYDHTKRPWYKRATGQRGLTVLSPPYSDALGAGYVVTLSHTLYTGRPSRQHSSDDPVIGVMSMDLSLTYLFNQLIKTFPACDTTTSYKCMVVDSSGYIVVHTDFVDISSGILPTIENIHIVQKEPAIAQDMINSNYMINQACINFENIREQYFWVLTLPSGLYGKRVTSFYEIHEIPDTNLFMVVVLAEKSSSSCECPDHDVFECPETTCRCPCHSATTYEFCKDKFTLGVDGWPPCLPDSPVVDLEQVRGSGEDLPQCFITHCQILTSKQSCVQFTACSWCEVTSSGENVEVPYCSRQSECSQGIIAVSPTPNITVTEPSGGGGANIGAIIGAVFAVIILVIIGGIAIWHFRKRYIIKKEKHDRAMTAANAILAEAMTPSRGPSRAQSIAPSSKSDYNMAPGSPGRPPPSYNSANYSYPPPPTIEVPTPPREILWEENTPKQRVSSPPALHGPHVKAASPPNYPAPGDPSYQNNSPAAGPSGSPYYMKPAKENIYEDIDTYSTVPQYMSMSQRV